MGKILNTKKGIAVIVVLIFAVAVGIAMSFIIRTTSYSSAQNKQTIYEMQAYYLAHSAMQFAKLHIGLLPKEIYDFYKNNSSNNDNVLDKCQSDLITPLSLTANFDKKGKYDLFTNNAPDEAFPYGGYFVVNNVEYLLSTGNMRMVQDSYKVEVKSFIEQGKDKSFSEILTEEFVVSRSGR